MITISEVIYSYFRFSSGSDKDAILSHGKDGSYLVTPYKAKSRLQAIANTTCLICIPEGVESLNRGDVIPVQIIAPGLGDLAIYYDSTL